MCSQIRTQTTSPSNAKACGISTSLAWDLPENRGCRLNNSASYTSIWPEVLFKTPTKCLNKEEIIPMTVDYSDCIVYTTSLLKGSQPSFHPSTPEECTTCSGETILLPQQFWARGEKSGNGGRRG